MGSEAVTDPGFVGFLAKAKPRLAQAAPFPCTCRHPTCHVAYCNAQCQAVDGLWKLSSKISLAVLSLDVIFKWRCNKSRALGEA